MNSIQKTAQEISYAIGKEVEEYCALSEEIAWKCIGYVQGVFDDYTIQDWIVLPDDEESGHYDVFILGLDELHCLRITGVRFESFFIPLESIKCITIIRTDAEPESYKVEWDTGINASSGSTRWEDLIEGAVFFYEVIKSVRDAKKKRRQLS